MAEGANKEVYENLVKIRKGIDENELKEHPIDPFKFSNKGTTEPMPTGIADNTDEKLKFNLPEAKNLSELHKDDEGVKEIVENVIVEADILSNRTDLKQETRDTFKKVVDTALDPKNTHFSITRDRINELATQRAENIQNNELVKESVHIIKKVDRVLSEINNSLEAIKKGLPGEIINMNNLYDNRKKLIVLQAQIKDREILKEIEGSINKIDDTIEEIINVVFLKIKEPTKQLDDEQDLADKLKNGNYKVLLSIPDFRS